MRKAPQANAETRTMAATPIGPNRLRMAINPLKATKAAAARPKAKSEFRANAKSLVRARASEWYKDLVKSWLT